MVPTPTLRKLVEECEVFNTGPVKFMSGDLELPTRRIDPHDPLVALLSEARLRRCRQLVQGNQERAVRLHQADADLAASLYGMLRTLEIGLRNTIDHRLRDHLATPDWILSPPQRLAWKDAERRAIGEALRRAESSGSASDTIRSRHDRVVSSLPFGFWCHLFKTAYENVLWRGALERFFPNRAIRGRDVFLRLDELREIRNRVAHHDAILPNRSRRAREAVAWLLHEMTPIPGMVHSRDAFGMLLTPLAERVERREARVAALLSVTTGVD